MNTYALNVGYDNSAGANNTHRAEARRVVADIARYSHALAFGYMIGPREIIVQQFSAAAPPADPFWFAKDWYQGAIPHAGYVAWFDARDLTRPQAEHFGTVTMVGMWPRHYGVGQAAAQQALAAAQPAYTSYDPTSDPNWAGARALVRSTVQSVLSNDAVFDQVARQVLGYLRQQGFVGAASRFQPGALPKLRAWIRQAAYYMDLDALIDVAARQLVHAARSIGKSPF